MRGRHAIRRVNVTPPRTTGYSTRTTHLYRGGGRLTSGTYTSSRASITSPLHSWSGWINTRSISTAVGYGSYGRTSEIEHSPYSLTEKVGYSSTHNPEERFRTLTDMYQKVLDITVPESTEVVDKRLESRIDQLSRNIRALDREIEAKHKIISQIKQKISNNAEKIFHRELADRELAKFSIPPADQTKWLKNNQRKMLMLLSQEEKKLQALEKNKVNMLRTYKQLPERYEYIKLKLQSKDYLLNREIQAVNALNRELTRIDSKINTLQKQNTIIQTKLDKALEIKDKDGVMRYESELKSNNDKLKQLKRNQKLATESTHTLVNRLRNVKSYDFLKRNRIKGMKHAALGIMIMVNYQMAKASKQSPEMTKSQLKERFYANVRMMNIMTSPDELNDLFEDIYEEAQTVDEVFPAKEKTSETITSDSDESQEWLIELFENDDVATYNYNFLESANNVDNTLGPIIRTASSSTIYDTDDEEFEKELELELELADIHIPDIESQLYPESTAEEISALTDIISHIQKRDELLLERDNLLQQITAKDRDVIVGALDGGSAQSVKVEDIIAIALSSEKLSTVVNPLDPLATFRAVNTTASIEVIDNQIEQLDQELKTRIESYKRLAIYTKLLKISYQINNKQLRLNEIIQEEPGIIDKKGKGLSSDLVEEFNQLNSDIEELEREIHSEIDPAFAEFFKKVDQYKTKTSGLPKILNDTLKFYQNNEFSIDNALKIAIRLKSFHSTMPEIQNLVDSFADLLIEFDRTLQKEIDDRMLLSEEISSSPTDNAKEQRITALEKSQTTNIEAILNDYIRRVVNINPGMAETITELLTDVYQQSNPTQQDDFISLLQNMSDNIPDKALKPTEEIKQIAAIYKQSTNSITKNDKLTKQIAFENQVKSMLESYIEQFEDMKPEEIPQVIYLIKEIIDDTDLSDMNEFIEQLKYIDEAILPEGYPKLTDTIKRIEALYKKQTLSETDLCPGETGPHKEPNFKRRFKIKMIKPTERLKHIEFIEEYVESLKNVPESSISHFERLDQVISDLNKCKEADLSDSRIVSKLLDHVKEGISHITLPEEDNFILEQFINADTFGQMVDAIRQLPGFTPSSKSSSLG